MLSSVCSTILWHPLDVLKTSLIHPENRNASIPQVIGRVIYPTTAANPTQTIGSRPHLQIHRLWRGLTPAVIRISSGSGIYFASQSLINRQLHPEYGQ